jgi:hypothetical protein
VGGILNLVKVAEEVLWEISLKWEILVITPKKWLKKLQVDQTVQHLASAKRNKLV